MGLFLWIILGWFFGLLANWMMGVKDCGGLVIIWLLGIAGASWAVWSARRSVWPVRRAWICAACCWRLAARF